MDSKNRAKSILITPIYVTVNLQGCLSMINVPDGTDIHVRLAAVVLISSKSSYRQC